METKDIMDNQALADMLHQARQEGRQEGRREVVEFIGDYTKPFPNQKVWWAKLKEWGIEEQQP